MHTVSVVEVHGCLTPYTAQVASAAHVVHGVLPEAEKEVPLTHGATVSLHTISVVVVQAVFTPVVHVALAVQFVHRAVPVLDHVEPSVHWLHVSVAQSVS